MAKLINRHRLMRQFVEQLLNFVENVPGVPFAFAGDELDFFRVNALSFHEKNSIGLVIIFHQSVFLDWQSAQLHHIP